MFTLVTRDKNAENGYAEGVMPEMAYQGQAEEMDERCADRLREHLQSGVRYLAASIVIAAAAAVYGLFSHGVYSYYMTYAFMIPLLGGALPHLIAALKSECFTTAYHRAEAEMPNDCFWEPDVQARTDAAGHSGLRDMQLAAIATLTVGSLLKGALDIYGTTNRLLVVYPAAAIIMIAAFAIIKKTRTGQGANKTADASSDAH